MITLVFIMGIASAQTQVIVEDAFSKLTATPSTTECVNSAKCLQEFELTNKTAQQQTNVWLAYVFNEPVRKGKLELWQESSIRLITRTIQCDHNGVFILNKYVGDNPHEATCYKTLDQNTTDILDDVNTIFWVQRFKSGNLVRKTITFDENVIVAGTWIDKTDLINQATINNKYIYYINDSLTFEALETKKWRIQYTATDKDTKKKKKL